jgi:hypothetical protein
VKPVAAIVIAFIVGGVAGGGKCHTAIRRCPGKCGCQCAKWRTDALRCAWRGGRPVPRLGVRGSRHGAPRRLGPCRAVPSGRSASTELPPEFFG